MSDSPFESSLDRQAANYATLTPLSFIRRSAEVYGEYTATIHGDIRRSWSETYARCVRLSSALKKVGVQQGDAVSIIAANIPEHFEAHFGVPMAGAVLNSINTRLDAATVAFILQHAGTRVFLVDREFGPLARAALECLKQKPIVIHIDDPQFADGELVGERDYETFIASGDEREPLTPVSDEWQAISLNYTSGTTGDPKGVVYHHRGACLNAISNVTSWSMEMHPVYLWTLPMFHCNGWCFPWSIALQAGVSVSLRHVRAEPIFELIRKERVGYFCGAPIVLNLLNSSPEELRQGIDHRVKVMTAGAAPPAAVIEGMESMGFEVTQVYGLTETYGPCVVSAWHEHWNRLPLRDRCELKARQGVRVSLQEDLMVADPDTMAPVPSDGNTMGEVMLRGNLVMKGYLKNPEATGRGFEGGWFHSGDLAVRHPDGYIEIRDRSKDIIISGGENISSIEIEGVLYRHPFIQEAAVVARRDDKWGESPCAFIELKEGAPNVRAEAIISFCRKNLAGFKVPKTIIFGPLPKTATGKIQKFVLRERANASGSP